MSLRNHGQKISVLTATVISDPDDKNFDLEAYLQHVAADHAK